MEQQEEVQASKSLVPGWLNLASEVVKVGRVIVDNKLSGHVIDSALVHQQIQTYMKEIKEISSLLENPVSSVRLPNPDKKPVAREYRSQLRPVIKLEAPRAVHSRSRAEFQSRDREEEMIEIPRVRPRPAPVIPAVPKPLRNYVPAPVRNPVHVHVALAVSGDTFIIPASPFKLVSKNENNEGLFKSLKLQPLKAKSFRKGDNGSLNTKILNTKIIRYDKNGELLAFEVFEVIQAEPRKKDVSMRLTELSDQRNNRSTNFKNGNLDPELPTLMFCFQNRDDDRIEMAVLNNCKTIKFANWSIQEKPSDPLINEGQELPLFPLGSHSVHLVFDSFASPDKFESRIAQLIRGDEGSNIKGYPNLRLALHKAKRKATPSNVAEARGDYETHSLKDPIVTSLVIPDYYLKRLDDYRLGYDLDDTRMIYNSKLDVCLLFLFNHEASKRASKEKKTSLSVIVYQNVNKNPKQLIPGDGQDKNVFSEFATFRGTKPKIIFESHFDSETNQQTAVIGFGTTVAVVMLSRDNSGELSGMIVHQVLDTDAALGLIQGIGISKNLGCHLLTRVPEISNLTIVLAFKDQPMRLTDFDGQISSQITIQGNKGQTNSISKGNPQIEKRMFS